MEVPQRPMSPKSLRSGNKLSQTLSRFKGIIRIPGPRRNGDGPPTARNGNSKSLDNNPYSRRSIAMKAYMSQPMLGELRDGGTVRRAREDSDPGSSSSASPVDRDCEDQYEFPLPRSSVHINEPPHDHHRRSRTLSLHSLQPKDIHAEETAKATVASPELSPTPPTPPPKSPSLFRVRKGQPTPPESISTSSSQSSGFKTFTRSLVRRASKTRMKIRTGDADEPPVPPLPSPYRHQQRSPDPQTQLESSVSTSSTATATPETVQQSRAGMDPAPSAEETRLHKPDPPTRASAPAIPTAKASVSSFVSSSGSSYQTAASTISTPDPKFLQPSGIPPVPTTPHKEWDAATKPEPVEPTAASSGVGKNGLKPLKIPMPVRRFSLISTEGTARLSPSLVLRPPPLPILNLPKLPTPAASSSGGDGVLTTPTAQSRRRSGIAGLRNMPALPLQGTARGVGGHEEQDDGDDDDEDDDEDGEIDDEDNEEDSSIPEGDESMHGRSSTSTEDGSDSQGRGSYDLGDSGLALSSSGSSSSAFSSLPSSSFGRKPELPPLDVTSPFVIRFPGQLGPGYQNLSTPTAFSSNAKGKSRQVPPPIFHSISSSSHSSGLGHRHGAASSSPVVGGGGNGGSQHYFDVGHGSGVDSGKTGNPSSLLASSGGTTQGQHVYPASSSSSGPGNSFQQVSQPTTPGGHAGNRTPLGSSSPVHTPRPDDYRLSQNQKHRILVAPPILDRYSSLSSQSNRSSNRMSVMGGTISAQRPSIYKHASKSLIDLHHLEKREEVERMVREGEEEQEKELRRRSTLRRNRDSVALNNLHSFSPNLDSRAQEMQKSMIEEKTEFYSIDGMDDEKGPDGESRLKGEGGPFVVRNTSGTPPTLSTAGGFTSTDGTLRDVSQKVVGSGETVHNTTMTPADDAWELIEGGPAAAATTMHQQLQQNQQKQQNRLSSAPAYDSIPHPLRKRRSMPVFNEATAPPPYPTFAPHPSAARFAHVKIQPRDDEGKEELPPYTNAIYLKAVLPRKMEFSQPGVQAKDRKWKRVLCVLDGTMLKVYKCPLGAGGVSVIEHWWENKVGAGDVAQLGGSMATGSVTGSSAALRPRGGVDGRNVEDEKAQQRYPGPLGVTTTLASEPIPPPPPPLQSTFRHKENSSQGALSRSALNLAVSFLKPGRHARSHSDVTPPSPTTLPRPIQPRSSLNLSRSATPTPSASSAAGSRSHSPMPTSSSTGTTPYGSESSSTNLTVPSSSGSTHSRPVTPSTASSTRSRFRSGTLAKTPQSGSTFSSKDSDAGEPNPDDLIRVYSLQNAESGLGNDYLKRKNVIRVRLEGEQFLLQAKDVASVVEWIEGLQAATNVALDLDERPMPRGPIFPRRRRRRRPQVPPISVPDGNTPAITVQNVTETYTPTSATAGQPALRRT